MDNKPLKTISLKKEVISNLNNGQMGGLFGGRNISAETLHNNHCDSLIQCCTMYKDCKTGSEQDTACCVSYTCYTGDAICFTKDIFCITNDPC